MAEAYDEVGDDQGAHARPDPAAGTDAAGEADAADPPSATAAGTDDDSRAPPRYSVTMKAGDGEDDRVVDMRRGCLRLPRSAVGREIPYVSNEIRTSKYTVWSFLPRNLFEQLVRRTAPIRTEPTGTPHRAAPLRTNRPSRRPKRTDRFRRSAEARPAAARRGRLALRMSRR